MRVSLHRRLEQGARFFVGHPVMHGQLSYIFSPQFTEPVVVPGLSGVGFALSPSPTCLDPGRVSTALAWILRYVRSPRVVLLTFAAELSLHYRPSMDGEFYFYILVKRRLMPCADHPDSSGNARAREFRAKKKEKQPCCRQRSSAKSENMNQHQ